MPIGVLNWRVIPDMLFIMSIHCTPKQRAALLAFRRARTSTVHAALRDRAHLEPSGAGCGVGHIRTLNTSAPTRGLLRWTSPTRSPSVIAAAYMTLTSESRLRALRELRLQLFVNTYIHMRAIGSYSFNPQSRFPDHSAESTEEDCIGKALSALL